MYDAFPDLPTIYDSVPVYVNRRDVQFYVDEAEASAFARSMETSIARR